MQNKSYKKIDLLVCKLGDVPSSELLRIANYLWDGNLRAEICADHLKMKELIKSALEKGASHLVIVGENELKDKKVVVKNLEKK